MNVKEFVTGGNATFTLYSQKLDKHITYRVRPAHTENNFFVYYLYNQDNTTDYTYLGVFNTKLYLTKASRTTSASDCFRMFSYFLDVIFDRREWPDTLKFLPSGRCGRCGRLLTTPESIERGFGPECYKSSY